MPRKHKINQEQKYKALLREAMETLEEVLTDGWSFSTEQSAEHIVTHIKKVMS